MCGTRQPPRQKLGRVVEVEADHVADEEDAERLGARADLRGNATLRWPARAKQRPER